jgi:hypothetical protein
VSSAAIKDPIAVSTTTHLVIVLLVISASFVDLSEVQIRQVPEIHRCRRRHAWPEALETGQL